MTHARLRVGGAKVEICIRNISSRGLLIQSATPPARGTYIDIIGPGYAIVGRVVWARGQRFGVRTQDPINVAGFNNKTASFGSADSQALLASQQMAGSGPVSAEQPFDRNRRRATAIQFVSLVAFGAFGAAVLASTIYENLSLTVAGVSASL